MSSLLTLWKLASFASNKGRVTVSFWEAWAPTPSWSSAIVGCAPSLVWKAPNLEPEPKPIDPLDKEGNACGGFANGEGGPEIGDWGFVLVVPRGPFVKLDFAGTVSVFFVASTEMLTTCAKSKLSLLFRVKLLGSRKALKPRYGSRLDSPCLSWWNSFEPLVNSQLKNVID